MYMVNGKMVEIALPNMSANAIINANFSVGGEMIL